MTINYTAMREGELLNALGDDAMKWAIAFVQIAKANKWTIDNLDEGLMVAWFANAIENASVVRGHCRRDTRKCTGR